MNNAVEKFHACVAKKPMTKTQVTDALDTSIRTMETKSFLDKQTACWKKEPVLVTVNPKTNLVHSFTEECEVYINVCTVSQSNPRETVQVTESALDELIKVLVETRSELSALRKAYNEELAKLPAEEKAQD